MAELVVGDEFAGYRVEGLAGRGGMGVVYRMRHLRLDRIDAVKVIAPQHAEEPEFRTRFERESRVAAGLEHPHVIQIYHAGEEDGRLYLAMRYVPGTDLRAELKRSRRLDVWRAVEIVRQVASALDAAHEIGLVHRDVKPANVLLSRRDGRDHAFLTDFGLTKDLSSRGRETRTGVLVGTTGYIAPEQVNGGPLTPQADIYSLGCVLYHLLSGNVPYPREMELAAAFAHVNEPVPSLVDVGEELARRFDPVIRIAMAKNPSDRFGTAGAFARAACAAADFAPDVGDLSPMAVVPDVDRPPAVHPESPTVEATPAGVAAVPTPSPGQREPALVVTTDAAGTAVARRERAREPDGRVIASQHVASSHVTASDNEQRSKEETSRRWTTSRTLGTAIAMVVVIGTVVGVFLLSRSGKRADGTLHVFWQGTDGHLYGLSEPGSNGRATRVVAAGRIGSPPSVAVSPGGQVDVFWKGTPHQPNLWELVDAGSGTQAHNLGGGTLGSQPAAAFAPDGTLHVFWQGTDGHLYGLSEPGSSGRATRVVAAGRIGSPPSVAVSPGGQVDVFWKGTPHQPNLWELVDAGSGTQAHNLGGGTLGSQPAAAFAPDGTLHVFWQGTDGHLYGLSEPGSSGRATRVVAAGRIGSPPSVAVSPGGQVDVFWKGTPHQPNLWELVDAGSGTQAHNLGGGTLGSQPAAQLIPHS